jgi:peptidoglycan/LPS O-acetylase OafA/YrhL
MQLKRHYPELEGIRGILSLIVLFSHLLGTIAPHTENPLLWGWGSMEFFFCISGFLIGRNFFMRYQGRLSVHYFVNRALRIWPLYYFAWGFAAIATALVGGYFHEGTFHTLGELSGPGPFLPALFLQNTEIYFRQTFDSMFLFYHAWSVALEEHFYLVLAPLAFVVCRKRSLGFIFVLSLLLLAFTALVRHYYLGFSPITLLSRLDGFVLGLALAFVEARAGAGDRVAGRLFAPASFYLLLACAMLSLAPYLAECYGWSGAGYSIYAGYIRPIVNPHFAFALFGFAAIGLIAVQDQRGPLSAVLRCRPLQALGRISYSTYLLHVPIVYALSPALITTLGLPLAWQLVLAPAATIALAYLTYHTIEKPFLKLKIYQPSDPQRHRGLTRAPISSATPAD